MQRAHIIFALIISLLLHALLFILLDGQRGSRASTSTTLNLTLQTTAREQVAEPTEHNEPSKETVAFPEPEPDVTAADLLAEQPPLLIDPEPSVHLSPAPEERPPLVKSLPTLNPRDLVMTLADDGNPSAFQAFIQEECSTADQSSLARMCDPDQDWAVAQTMTPAETSLFEAAFNRLSASDRDFNKDMNRVARLVERRAGLSALDPEDPLQVALVAEQRRELRSEILRLDNKYAEANLLRLIPISRKVLKGLQEVSKKKN